MEGFMKVIGYRGNNTEKGITLTRTVVREKVIGRVETALNGLIKNLKNSPLI